MLYEYHLLVKGLGDYRVALVAGGAHVREVVPHCVQLPLVQYHAVGGVVIASVHGVPPLIYGSSFAFKARTAFVCIWHTRLSEIPSDFAISEYFMFL